MWRQSVLQTECNQASGTFQSSPEAVQWGASGPSAQTTQNIRQYQQVNTLFINDTHILDITWKKTLMFSRAKKQIKISVKELSIILEAFLLGANELHLHLSSNQHFLILHTWNTESKAAESFVPQLHLHQQHQLLEQLETLLALLPWFLTLHLSSELKHKSRPLELSSLKGDPRRLLPLIVHSCGQSFVYLQEIHNRFWFDQPDQWARATYTEWIFRALFNSPCHQ